MSPPSADGPVGVGGKPIGQLVGAVLCGGRSRRFGPVDKALAPTGDGPLGRRVVDALRGAGVDPVVAVGGTAGPALGLVTVPDRWPDHGPLAGLASVLGWVRTGDVLVVPCDLPLLTADAVVGLVEVRDRLRAGGDVDGAVVATVDGRPRHSLAIWPARRSVGLRRLIDGGRRRFDLALDVGPWVGVELPDPAVLHDVDTADDLADIIGDEAGGPGSRPSADDRPKPDDR